MRKRIQKDPKSAGYSDFAIQPVIDAEGENLEIFNLNDAAKEAVEKAKRQKEILGKTQNKEKKALA